MFIKKLPSHLKIAKFVTAFFFSGLFFFLAQTQASAATITWDGGGIDTNWSTCANWSGDTCPVAADAVVFSSTSTKNSTVDAGFGGVVTTVSINTGYSGTITLTRSLQTTSTFTQSTGSFTASNQTLDIDGAFTLNSGANFTASSGTMTFASTFTINSGATFTHNSGTVTFDGGTATLSCNNVSFNRVAFAHVTTIKTVNSTCSLPLGNNPTIPNGITLNGTLSGTGTLTTTPNQVFTINTGGSLSGFSGLALNTSLVIAGATADFSGYSTFSMTLGTLTLNSGTLSLPSGTDLNGALSITGGTFNAPTGNMTLASGLTISGSPTFNHNNGTFTFDGGLATLSCNNVVFNLVVFAHTAGQVKTISSNCSLPLGNNPSVSSHVTLNGTLSGAGTFTQTTGTLTLNSGAALSGFSGMSFLSTSAMTVAGGTIDLSGYSSFSTVTGAITVSSGSLSLPSGSDLNGNFTLSGGTFTAPSGNMSLTGSLTISNLPTFNANGGTITFDGTSGTIGCTKSDSSVISFNRVVIANTSSVKTISAGCIIPLGDNPNAVGGGSLTVNGTLTGTGLFTINLISTTSVLTMNTGSSLSGFSGLYTDGLTVAGATIDLSGYTSYRADSTVSVTSGSLSLPSGSDLNGQLTISGGTFTAPTGTMNIEGNFTITGTPVFNANGGTINFDTGGATLSCNNVTFNLVTFTHTGGNKLINTNCTIPVGNNPFIGNGGSFQLSGNLTGSGVITTTGTFIIGSVATVNGFSGVRANGLTVAGPTLDWSDYTVLDVDSLFSITTAATFTAPDLMTVGGNFSHTSGSFNHNNGTVVLDGTGSTTVRTNNTFYNLMKETAGTLTFDAGTTQIIEGTLTLEGSEGNLINLRSATPGSQWSLDPKGARNISYVDVQDSRNIHGTAISAFLSTNRGNNTGWLFPSSETHHSLVSPSDRSYVSDERPVFSWRPPNDEDYANGIRDYTLKVDNGNGLDFEIQGIPAEPAEGHTYEEDRYMVEYLNWDDDDISNNLISLKTKSSSQWQSTQNDGKVSEGKRVWKVMMTDQGGVTTELSTEFFADLSAPEFHDVSVNTISYAKELSLSDTTPTLKGKISDVRKGSPDDKQVVSGPHEYTLTLEKKELFKGYQSVLSKTITLSDLSWEEDDTNKNAFFEFTPDKELSYGTYRVTVRATDKAGNVSNSLTVMLKIRKDTIFTKVVTSLEKTNVINPGTESEVLTNEIPDAELLKSNDAMPQSEELPLISTLNVLLDTVKIKISSLLTFLKNLF